MSDCFFISYDGYRPYVLDGQRFSVPKAIAYLVKSGFSHHEAIAYCRLLMTNHVVKEWE